MVTETTPDDVAERIDVTGESCPLSVARTKQAVDDIAVGEVLELLAQSESEADGQTVYHHDVERVGERVANRSPAGRCRELIPRPLPPSRGSLRWKRAPKNSKPDSTRSGTTGPNR